MKEGKKDKNKKKETNEKNKRERDEERKGKNGTKERWLETKVNRIYKGKKTERNR